MAQALLRVAEGDDYKLRRQVGLSLGEGNSKAADAALVDFARELFTDYNVAADTYARAARAFGETDLVDLVALMGAHAADAAVLAAFNQQLPEGVEPRLPLP